MESVRKLKYNEKSQYYDSTGLIISEIKDKCNIISVDSNNFEHSINDQPAFIHYFSSSFKKISYKWWYKHGRPHRLTGPAYISYRINGDILTEKYYLNGKKLMKNDWNIEVNRIKMLNNL